MFGKSRMRLKLFGNFKGEWNFLSEKEMARQKFYNFWFGSFIGNHSLLVQKNVKINFTYWCTRISHQEKRNELNTTGFLNQTDLTSKWV